MAVRKDSIQITVDIEADAGVKAFQQLTDRADKARKAMMKIKDEGKENTEEFKKLEKELAEVNEEFGKLGGAGATMGQLIGRSRRLNREIKSLAPGTKRYIEATKELKQVNDRLATMRRETRGVAEGLEEMRVLGIKMPQWVSKMNVAFKAFVALEIIGLFLRAAQATNQMTQEVVNLQRSIAQMTGASGNQLDDFTSRINAISGTFGKESDEVLRAANALSKQLGVDFSQSLDLIEKGFLAGADANGQFLDNLKEYPATIANVIDDGEQLISVLAQSVTDGVFSDKGIDALKEFELRIREMTPATADALRAIGTDSVKIKKLIEEEGIGAAFTEVQSKLQELREDSPAVGQALADIFGGPGEDAGIRFLKNLDLTGDALENLIEKGGEHVELLQEQLEANKELEEAQTDIANSFKGASSSLQVYMTRAKTFLLNTAVSILDFFEQLPATAKGVQAAFVAVINNVQVFFSKMATEIAIDFKKVRKAIAIRGTVRRELEGEIKDLEAARDKIASTSVSIGEAYRSSFLEGMEKVRARQKVNEVLLENANRDFQRDGERDGTAYGESFTKAAKEKIKEAPPIPKEIIEDFEIGEEDIDLFSDKLFASKQTKLKNFYLQGLMTQEEYEEERFNLEIRSYDQRLAALREKYGQDSEQYQSLLTEKLQAIHDFNKEVEKQPATFEQYLNASKSLLNEFHSFRVGLIDREISELEQKEKKQGELSKSEEKRLKALAEKRKKIEIQKTIVNGLAEVAGIWRSVAGIAFPGNVIIGGALTTAAALRTATAINAIKSKNFYEGGFTGNTPLFKDNQGRDIVGGVHAHEWVAKRDLVEHPIYGEQIRALEYIQRNNFMEGGFTTTPPRSVVNNATQSTSTADFSMLQEQLDMQLKEMRMTRIAIERQRLELTTGQIRDAMEEDRLLDVKSGF